MRLEELLVIMYNLPRRNYLQTFETEKKSNICMKNVKSNFFCSL